MKIHYLAETARRRFTAWLWFLTLAPLPAGAASTAVHTTWLWHLHQPIYWPDRRSYGTDHYENAWDTIQQQNAGRPHPSPEILSQIFNVADRVNAYQGQPKSTINSLFSFPNAGAQVSYSGALIENVQSLAAAGQLGYGAGWNNANQTARGWTTSGGKPRLDLVNFTYHHALAPLLSDATFEMELRLERRQMEIFWNTNIAPLSSGYFPAETCFSERLIPILKMVGINWSVVANTHLARACPDMPVVTGSGGEMCDLPNRADQLNPAQGAGNYQRLSIDRGCAPIQAMPFGFQLHYARYVDPDTGAETKLILAPSDQVFGWKDSYSTWDLGLIAPLAARNDPGKPALVFCAHDGDNAWSGGSSYYNEWVPNMASTAAADGYEPTTVEQFIADFLPNASDVVHVEDGGWVFADGDFGSPMFINWHWPPSYSSNGVNVVDPSLGVSDKADNWRVIIATENRVKTAQQISGITPNLDQVRDPGSFSGSPNAVELGWHYYLASLDSGFVYYGCHDDECQRAVAAQSNAVRNVNAILAGNPAADATPPTVFIPQRHPWNPGGTNFGNQYGYKLTVAANSDFWVWTYAYDVSGVTNVSLLFRVNGTNPPTSDQFKTYAGGALAGAWQALGMSKRVVTPILGVTPQYLADYYYAKISGVSNAFVDYYVLAVDAYGNTNRTPIQHVWVDAGSGSSGGGGNTNACIGRACISPAPAAAGQPVTISYSPAGGPIATSTNLHLHLGWNNWATVVSPDPLLISNALTGRWEFTTTNPATATELDCDFNNGSSSWDNNGGSGVDYRFAVVTNGAPQPPPAPASLTASAASASQVNLSWTSSAGATGYVVNRGGAPIATTTAAAYSDGGLSSNTTYCYAIVATNSLGNSAPTAAQCVALQPPPTPAVLSATAAGTNQINLTWSATTTATGYVVNRGGSPIATTTTAGFADTGLSANTSFCYTVIATNAVGRSAPTPPKCATTLTNNPNLCNGRACVAPAPMVAGSLVTISYTPAGGPIATASNVFIHLGWNKWATVVSSDPAMTFNTSLNLWQFSTTIPTSATELDSDFNNGAGAWDNNGGAGADYRFTVNTNASVTVTNFPPFVLDGVFDSAGYLLTSSGMVLYGALRGTTLYVATWSPGNSGPNDHFLFVSDQLLPAASAPAPWAKAGNIAVSTNKPYLAGESQGGYVSWFANGLATNWPCAKFATNSGALEGTLDLLQAFGSVPAYVYLCAAAYITTNGGPLVAQCPAGTGPDLETNEFLVIPTAALRDSAGNGTFDLCDPARGFRILSANAAAGGRALTWAAMPGRSYQVVYANALTGAWTNLPGASNFATPPQLALTYTDAPSGSVTQRFYRVKLLP